MIRLLVALLLTWSVNDQVSFHVRHHEAELSAVVQPGAQVFVRYDLGGKMLFSAAIVKDARQ